MDVTGPYILESCGSYRFHIKIESLIHEIKIFDKKIIIRYKEFFAYYSFDTINYTLNQTIFPG